MRTGIVGWASSGSGTALTACGTGALARTTGAGADGLASAGTPGMAGPCGGLSRAAPACAAAAIAGVPRVGIATDPPTEFMGPSTAGIAGIVARSEVTFAGGRSIRTMSL